MSLWPAARPIFGDEIVLRSIDWLENFPWRNESTVNTEGNKYEIRMNVKGFGPKEITVKTSDGFIVVEGKQDEKQDEYGYISRHFVRRYALPDGCKPQDIQSRLSPEGILIITLPRIETVKKDTVIPIKHEKSKSKL